MWIEDKHQVECRLKINFINDQASVGRMTNFRISFMPTNKIINILRTKRAAMCMLSWFYFIPVNMYSADLELYQKKIWYFKRAHTIRNEIPGVRR